MKKILSDGGLFRILSLIFIFAIITISVVRGDIVVSALLIALFAVAVENTFLHERTNLSKQHQGKLKEATDALLEIEGNYLHLLDYILSGCKMADENNALLVITHDGENGKFSRKFIAKPLTQNHEQTGTEAPEAQGSSQEKAESQSEQ